MKLYQAPLEGITGYIYRNALMNIFGGVDKYYAPFISPYEKRIITDREKNQICTEHNINQKLVPQIMTMDSKGFIELTDWIFGHYGYDEFNLNFGCPSGTVVSKGRGAGSLGDLEKLEKFLDEIMGKSKYKISVKTRIGLHNQDEWEDIAHLYNKYNFEEVIIHPRIRDELYNGKPHKDVFFEWVKISTNPVVYNGDIRRTEDYLELNMVENNIDSVMIGRGMVANPAIFREIKGGKPMERKELEEFMNLLLSEYSREFSGEVPVLHKMKEIWTYMGSYLTEDMGADQKVLKKLIKSKKLSEYKIYEKEMIKCVN